MTKKDKPAELDSEKGKITYIIGKEPYKYKAVAINDLNLAMYKWVGEQTDKKTGETRPGGWREMRKYASGLEGAVRIALNDAQHLNPRKRNVTMLVEGAEDICKHLDKIKRALSKIAIDFEGANTAAESDGQDA